MFRHKKDHLSNYYTPVNNHEQKNGKKGTTQTTTNYGIEKSRLRIKLVVVIFCLLWVGLWGRAWYLQIIEGPRLADKANRQHMSTELIAGKRGVITDRNGQIMAKSVAVSSVGVRPKKIEDVMHTATVIAPLLGMDTQNLYGELSTTKRSFMWLKRKVDDYSAEMIRKANLSGIELIKEYDRIYPFKHMAGQLLGFVGVDDKGLEGLENSLEDKLGCIPVRQIMQRDAMGRKFYLHGIGTEEPKGEDVALTLDMQIQFIAEEACEKVALEFGGRWSGALVIDVENGDILAWAQYPFFNPNSFKEVPQFIYRNRLAADAMEPGSTFKPLVMAAALEERKITPNTLINCEGGKWEIKNLTLRDTSTRGIIPANKVIRYSSNIGMAKIGISMGSKKFYNYLRALGFGERTNLPVSESKGILRIPREWSSADTMATSFGQSISVTAIQMAQAYLTLLNKGSYKPLRLLMENDAVSETPRRIFSEKTAQSVMDMMKDVVQEDDGTGKHARINGIEIGGKTGTAQKADHKSGAYGIKRLASFIGFFPAKDPKYLVLVLVDEPTKNQYGGIVAAPAFKEIAFRLLTYTGYMNESQVSNSELQPIKNFQRSLKLASIDSPWVNSAKLPLLANNKQKNYLFEMRGPGHLSRPASQIPDVTGKSVRNAVELFARAGIVPELKGSGSRVIRQIPPPGSAWKEKGKNSDYILWLSER